MYNYIPIKFNAGGGFHKINLHKSLMREDQRMGSFGYAGGNWLDF